MDQRTGAVLDLAAQLLREVANGAPPLGMVSMSLAELAEVLEVDRVVVAIDDPEFGRQLFCSSRRPVGAFATGLEGPPRVCTEPPSLIDGAAEAMLLNVVRAAFTRAVQRGRSQLRVREPRLDELTAAVRTATARAVRYGWVFALVCVALDVATNPGSVGIGPSLQEGLRAGDIVVELGPGRLGVLIPAIRDEHVPAVLARIAGRGGLPPFSFGVVCCPGDGTDAPALVERGLQRLQDAQQVNNWRAGIRASGLGARYIPFL